MLVQLRPGRSRWALISLKTLAVASFLSGCASSALSRGAECYTQKRYIDAAQIFEHHEPELAGYADADKARYGVYRGLTLIALGDEAAGQRWLSYGTSLAQTTLQAPERNGLMLAVSASKQATPAAAVLAAAPAPGASVTMR